jgi:hypothetical protein
MQGACLLELCYCCEESDKMSISQIESELITLITVEAYLERSLKSILSKKEKDQLKQTRRSLNETRKTLLELLEIYKSEEQNKTLQNNPT